MKIIYDLGMIGLGVMGQNLVLNLADQGFSVAGYDRDKSKIGGLKGQQSVFETADLKEFVSLLQTPRAIMMMVPAGNPVDSVIQDLLPYLEKGDILIDGGNSYFKDTNLRIQNLAKKGIHLLGVGISGGEEGARHGPSMMPGGSQEAYARISPFFEKTAAKVDGDPCVDYLGPSSAGHFVKMVHNGIEYGLMQLISETYDLMKRGLGIDESKMHAIYDQWNQGELNSYLLEITAHIFQKRDISGKLLIDDILDVAKQKGTGMWTSQSAMELQVPDLNIDIAVDMRDLSMLHNQRTLLSKTLKRPVRPLKENGFVEQMAHALYGAMIVVYAQGMAVLKAASEKYQYGLNLETIARIWRGGCIIRSALLEPIREAYRNNPELPHLLGDPIMSEKIMHTDEDLRGLIAKGVQTGIPLPGFMSALSYLDAFRSDWLPANLIQAQRDFFGAHTYERIDANGVFHTQWE
ncbi:MAG: NADP-dependent phosphogluconate dehydrogenase [Parachlamydia sp.]|nr:NADP-dependent phosphogluconate dehydrogenase [Parachlamydia sp.]